MSADLESWAGPTAHDHRWTVQLLPGRAAANLGTISNQNVLGHPEGPDALRLHVEAVARLASWAPPTGAAPADFRIRRGGESHKGGRTSGAEARRRAGPRRIPRQRTS